ncbi:hypothetical protein LXL04_005015 [Taraxacum kok-saghyz]
MPMVGQKHVGEAGSRYSFWGIRKKLQTSIIWRRYQSLFILLTSLLTYRQENYILFVGGLGLLLTFTSLKNRMFRASRMALVADVEKLVSSLCMIRIGNLLLHANVSTRPQNAPKTNSFRPILFQREKPIDTQARKLAVSYANMVSGKKQEKVEAENQATQSSSTSIDCEVMNLNAYPFALLARFKDFRAISNTRCMCQGEGFGDVDPKYLGGLWVLLEFQSMERRKAFLAHTAVTSWIDELKPWHNDFVVKDRILWVEVEGVPLLAWSEDTFKRIASK